MAEASFFEEVELTIELYESAIVSVASRTRQMIERDGAVNALSKLTANPDLQKRIQSAP